MNEQEHINDYADLTQEQEDYMLEESLERVREEKNPTTYELTIQKLTGEKEKEGWTNDEFWEKVDMEMAFEMEKINEQEREERNERINQELSDSNFMGVENGNK